MRGNRRLETSDIGGKQVSVFTNQGESENSTSELLVMPIMLDRDRVASCGRKMSGMCSHGRTIRKTGLMMGVIYASCQPKTNVEPRELFPTW